MEYRIVGDFIQHLEVRLYPGEEFYAEKGALIYLESGVEKEVKLNGGGLGRIISVKLSGESMFMMRLYNPTDRPRLIVLGSKCGLLPVNLTGETMICHRGVYVGSCGRVEVSTKLSLNGLAGGMGLMLQKITGNTTVFLDTNGTPAISAMARGMALSGNRMPTLFLRSRNLLGTAPDALSTNVTGAGVLARMKRKAALSTLA